MLLVKLLKNVFSGKFGAKIWAVGWIEPFLFGHKRVIAWSEFFFFFWHKRATVTSVAYL